MTEILKKNPHEIMEVSLYDIVVDEERYPRAEIFETIINELAEALSKGIKLPPIEVYGDGEPLHLADGVHRFEAYRLEGFDLIPAIVHEGGRKEALFHALGANTDHGLRRTNADKEKAVTIALMDDEIKGYSDNRISKICKVSQPFVSRIRMLLTNNGYKFGPTRLCSNGQMMNVSNHGPKVVVDPGPNAPRVTPPASGPGQNDQAPKLEGGGTGESGQGTGDTGVENVDPAITNPDALGDETTDPADTNPDALDDEASDSAGTDPDAPSNENNESGEGAGDKDQENSNLDDLDPAALKLMVIDLQDITQKQEAEIEVKTSHIAELEQLVKELKLDNEYLKQELQGSVKAEAEISAFLDTNSMNEEHGLFGA